MPKFTDFTGMKIGRLYVIKRVENKVSRTSKSEYAQWLCKCDCGKEKVVISAYLNKANDHASCGCYVDEIKHSSKNKFKTHGLSKTRLFTIWRGMKERCYNKNHIHYKNYGGRGINICDEWMGEDGFQKFYNWANNNGYKKFLTIDRINNGLGYSPDNCRWSTPLEQGSNKRNTVFINNSNKKLTPWARKNNADRRLVYWRNKHGWDYSRLNEPPRKLVAEKQSGVKGVIWNKKQKHWIVKGIKNGKKDCYLKEFKSLDEALKFKKEYDAHNV